MCDPVSMIGLAIGAASSVMQYSAQSQAADAQDRMYEQNRLNSLAAFEDQQAATNMRISQEREAGAAENFDAALEARAARASNRVAAGEAGISGITVESLINDIGGAQARSQDRVNTNVDWTVSQLNAEKKAQGSAAVSRINSVQKGQRPNFLATGLQIAGQGLNTYSSYKQRQLGR